MPLVSIISRCHNLISHILPQQGYFACKACDYPLYSSASKLKDSGWDAYSKCYFSGDESHVVIRGFSQVDETYRGSIHLDTGYLCN
jgi:peptide methionine sulfoxide reductase MsrB